MNETTRLLMTMWAVAGMAGFVYGCSGASTEAKTNDPLPENTGAVTAKLTNVPSDVQCVDIQTSDWRTQDARVDVTPGGSAELRIAPLSTGSVWLTGTAYNVPCYAIDYYYYGDAGSQSQVTWVADSTYVAINAGQTTQTELHFHQLGAADVTIDFDNCDPNSSFGSCDGGGPPPTYDGGTPVTADAGFASPPAQH